MRTLMGVEEAKARSMAVGGVWRGAGHIIKSSTGSTELIYRGLLIFLPFVVDTEIEPDE